MELFSKSVLPQGSLLTKIAQINLKSSDTHVLITHMKFISSKRLWVGKLQLCRRKEPPFL